MKRILLINSVLGTGSTGKIVAEYAEHFLEEGYDVRVAYGRGSAPAIFKSISIRIGGPFSAPMHALSSRLFDNSGLGSKKATQLFLKTADEFNPDVLWLHNLHGYYLNLPLLFEWIRTRPQMKVILTLHDCWLFTGHCSHFTSAGCRQWESGCHSCPANYSFRKAYPKTWTKPKCERNFAWKKTLLSNLPNLQLVVPSEWLKSEVEKSFLSGYPISVIKNHIDLSVFRKTESDLKKKFGLENSTVILSVANSWTPGKGFLDIPEIAKNLDASFTLILVGTRKQDVKKLKNLMRPYKCRVKKRNDATELVFGECNFERVKHNYTSEAIPRSPESMIAALLEDQHRSSSKRCVSKIICFEQTNSQHSLAQLYSLADAFINCTHEDNYPTVNLEATSCECPVLTYDVGGCKETIEPQPAASDFWGKIDRVLLD